MDHFARGLDILDSSTIPVTKALQADFFSSSNVEAKKDGWIFQVSIGLLGYGCSIGMIMMTIHWKYLEMGDTIFSENI